MGNFNRHDLKRNACMLTGSLAREGYDWWWHSFTATNVATKEKKAFFIEYYICNPKLAEKEPVLGQLKANQRQHKKPSYLMVKAGAWGEDARQLHRFYSLENVSLRMAAPYQIEAQDCYASDFRIEGKIEISEEEVSTHPEWMCDSGQMQWKLNVKKEVAFNVGYGASKLLRELHAFEMYWHAEGMKTLYSGTILYNGERYEVTKEDSYGYADKNWGKGFTSPWVWLSSCHLTSRLTGKTLKNTVFDIGGGRPKIYFLPLNRKLLSAFYYEGREFEFNFSKFWTLTRTKFACKETEDEVLWHVVQSSIDGMMDVRVRCKKSEMLLVNYESPDGAKRHNRLWNGGTGIGRIRLYKRTRKGYKLVDDMNADHIGCEYGEYGE